MNELKDEPIEQGTRKRTDYENRQRARLALNIERTDGGILQIIVEKDMQSCEEEPEVQQNTFLAVMPLARLPGHEQYNQPPKGALPRPGRIYVFREGKLWRELTCDGKGNLSDVDVAYWRQQAEQQGMADNRPSVGKQQPLMLVPMLLKGQFVGNDYQIAYSELPWTWEYVDWLEADSSRVASRCQILGPAWSAAVVGPTHWRATQALPVVVIDGETEGLRPRDFSIETLMDDPAQFKPALAEFPENDWSVKLQQTLEQLATYEGTEAPQPLTEFTAAADVLTEKAVRGYPQLVGLILDDPLFALRHSVAQLRQAEQYLLALNALIPHQPNGPYAQVLHSTVMQQGSNPLEKFKRHLQLDQVDEVVFERQRRSARNYMEVLLRRLVSLFDGSRLADVAQDWLISRDERLLEPYVLLAESLDALCKDPTQSDALCLGSMSGELQGTVSRLSQSLLSGTHDLTRALLAGLDGELPEAVKRLKALAAESRAPEPAKLGLSSLLQVVDIDPEDTDRGLVFKNLHALIGDLTEYFSLGVLTHLNRLNTSGALLQVEFGRMLAPSMGVFDQLSPKWQGLQLITAGEAQAQNLRILGVNTGNLRHGLAPADRLTLTRKDFLFGNIHDQQGKLIGSSSPRQLGGNIVPNQGKTMVIAGLDDHPEVRRFSAWRTFLSAQIETVAQTPTMPLVAVACALYNLQAQVSGMKGLQTEAGDGDRRYQVGALSAAIDLSVAIGNLTKPMLGQNNGLVQLINKPRFEVLRPFPQWRANLVEQTGSPRLPILRALSGGAMVLSATLSAWDAKRAWHQGDRDAALAYSVAAGGGAAWGAYALGMSINPFVLAAGAILFIGGTIVAGWLVDSDIEALLKNGPYGKQHGQVGVVDSLLGDDQRFAHLADPHNAYTQLIGVLGKPVVRVERLADWIRSAPALQRAQVEHIAGQRIRHGHSCQRTGTLPLEGEDWVVTLHSPLLSMFGGEQQFQFHAVEQLGVLPRTGTFNVERVEHRPIDEAKLAALPLDESSVLYVLPKQFPVMELTPLQRHYNKVTQRLKIMAQFHLNTDEATRESLVLPQPNPKRWQPYSSTFSRTPAQHAKPNEVPYWLIETTEFKV